MSNISSYEIGLTRADMVNVEELTVPMMPPASSFEKWAQSDTLGSGHEAAMGFPFATWLWGFIYLEERNSLKGMLSLPSADVYIRSKTHEGEFVVFSGICKWPVRERLIRDIVTEFELKFDHLVEQWELDFFLGTRSFDIVLVL